MAVSISPSPIMVNASFDQFDRREERIAELAGRARKRSHRHEMKTITPMAYTISA
jgi:hypothetical protein